MYNMKVGWHQGFCIWLLLKSIKRINPEPIGSPYFISLQTKSYAIIPLQGYLWKNKRIVTFVMYVNQNIFPKYPISHNSLTLYSAQVPGCLFK